MEHRHSRLSSNITIPSSSCPSSLLFICCVCFNLSSVGVYTYTSGKYPSIHPSSISQISESNETRLLACFGYDQGSSLWLPIRLRQVHVAPGRRAVFRGKIRAHGYHKFFTKARDSWCRRNLIHCVSENVVSHIIACIVIFRLNTHPFKYASGLSAAIFLTKIRVRTLLF